MDALGSFLLDVLTLLIGYALLEYGVYRLKGRPTGALSWIITALLVLLGLGTFMTAAAALVPPELVRIFDGTSMIEGILDTLWAKVEQFGEWLTSR